MPGRENSPQLHERSIHHAKLRQTLDNDQFEFVELENTGSDRIDLTGVKFVNALNGDDSQGFEFEFATQTLDPGEQIVVVRNLD